jgi:Fe-Mn family superoxide dismutase
MEFFKLIELPFGKGDLSPVISEATITFHHGKHLQTYINNLNAALEGSGFEDKELIEIVKNSDGGIFNNAGQILNHNMYFEALRPVVTDNKPNGKLFHVINAQFSSFEAFQKEFVQKGTTLFGSGWVWLSCDDSGKLVISQEPNAQNPIVRGLHPLLTFDVWEHAYYLDYQNRRAAHLSALWQILDWSIIAARYK